MDALAICFAIFFAASLGYLLGTVMTTGKLADAAFDAAAPRRTKITRRGKNSGPHVVLISPTERRNVKSI